jgi:uncharacterized glyoxalase superfamily protein PhnB
MKPTPKGWPRISSSLYCKDPAKHIDWLCQAFGFEVRLKVEGDGGTIVHSELTYGDDGLVMVGGSPSVAHPEWTFYASPSETGGKNTQNMFIYVDDVEAHCERARKAGAKIFMEPKTSDYGEEYWADRTYGAIDPEGHHWWVAQRMRG